MSKSKFHFLLLMIPAACTTQAIETRVSPEIIQVEEKIAEAVDQASSANAAISEIESSTFSTTLVPGPEIPPSLVLPPESVQPITVDWNGPVESFLESVAKRAGYDFVSTGRRPANQVMIVISARDEPLFGVVRRTGNMIHGHANIAFNPELKKIELRYGG